MFLSQQKSFTHRTETILLLLSIAQGTLHKNTRAMPLLQLPNTPYLSI